MRLVGLLGGTFDPVHYGHLRIALELKQAANMDELRLLPNALPPHRDVPGASAPQRLDMLRLALRNQSELTIDDRELNREGPSYMVDTLRSLRDELGNGVALAMIVGSDSFQSINTWRQWRELINLAHIVIACRPGWRNNHESEVGRELHDRFIESPIKLSESPSGYILPWQVTQLQISATEIRKQVATRQSPRYLLPDDVLNYIQTNHLYQ